MKIECLEHTNPAHPKDSILRIFDFDASEACLFREILLGLADGSRSEISMNSLPFVESVGGCSLVLKAGPRDKGVRKVKDTFECVLTRFTWDNAEGLVEPFCEGNK